MKLFELTMKIPQPFPYQGSKRRIARKILSYFPEKSNFRLIEPFAGSAAISLAAATYNKATSFVINDANEPLINLWRTIVDQPQEISLKYKNLWNEQLEREHQYYNQIREKFNRTKRPEYLLYLMARCVKAAIRYNSFGEFNQSPDNRRRGMSPASMKENIFRSSYLLRGRVTFLSEDYKDVLNVATQNDLVYMDPPYQGVCCNRDQRYIRGVKFDEFVTMLENLNRKDVPFIVSYDGRTGDKLHGEKLPGHLQLTHLEINAGKSTQATLLGRQAITFESIYLSQALNNKIRESNFAREEQLELAGSFQ
ncbi:MAG: DNA adenine methylase [Candidatus Omnitrophota bacterium]|nr:DNA adenine methylase [Candidatus Omnitrophota bacterium]